MTNDVRFTQFCSCGCQTVIGNEHGMMLPAADLADNFVFEFDGELDYIEVFVRAHVIGRTFRNSANQPFTVYADGDISTYIAGDYSPLRS